MFHTSLYTVWSYVESIYKKYCGITLGSSEIEKHVGGTLLNSPFWGGGGWPGPKARPKKVRIKKLRARQHRAVFIDKMNCLVKSIKHDTFSSGSSTGQKRPPYIQSRFEELVFSFFSFIKTFSLVSFYLRKDWHLSRQKFCNRISGSFSSKILL